MRTLKAEGLRQLIAVPLDEATMADKLRVFLEWDNDARPNRGLGRDTPNEVFFGRSRARDGPRFDLRDRYPTRNAALRAEPGTAVELCVERFQCRAHLPVIELRLAA